MGARTLSLITDVLGAYPPDMRILNPYALAAAGGGFLPSDAPGVQYYGKASTLALSDNDLIDTLPQLSSGSGTDAAASGSVRPVFKDSVAAFGNKAVARFSGGINWLTGSVTMGGTTGWCFVVGSIESSSGNNGRIVSFGQSGLNDYDSANRWLVGRNGSSESVMCFRNFASNNTPITYSQPFILVARFDGTDGFISIDGGSEVSFGSTGTFSVAGFRIGGFIANDSGADSHVGDIAEVAFGTGNLSPTDISNLVGYAHGEYGL